MENQGTIKPLQKIDWRWVGVGYCFFVVFHLLPSYLLASFSRVGLEDKGTWLVTGLAFIAFYVGYRSRGITILEPAISALFYILTLALLFERFWGRSLSWHSAGIVGIWAVSAMVIALVSAWVGELVQSLREQKIRGAKR
ncbi:MAG: hypothetical protein WBD36_11745 [Bacteroidota bacterium]